MIKSALLYHYYISSPKYNEVLKESGLNSWNRTETLNNLETERTRLNKPLGQGIFLISDSTAKTIMWFHKSLTKKLSL